jgi:hypothetical protein
VPLNKSRIICIVYVCINRSECAHDAAEVSRLHDSGHFQQMEVCKRLTFWEDIPVSSHTMFCGPEIPYTFPFYPLEWHVRIVLINSVTIFSV